MAINTIALEFLSTLERAENRLLTWGLVDGFFSEQEIEDRADLFLKSVPEGQVDCPFDSAWSLAESLIDGALLWRIPGTERYRTRMAETVRLFVRLRQIFPDPTFTGWRTAPNLVADYRLLLKRRLYPKREIYADEVVARLRQHVSLLPIQVDVISALTRKGTKDELGLAHFQVRGAERILSTVGQSRSFGTIVSSGTGSGKTLAFYLPAYAGMSPSLSNEYWTKCLALYPRNELLKDQLREALNNARRIAPALQKHGRRKLIVAALYGDVPFSAEAVRDGRSSWTKSVFEGRAAYVCPFVRCPRCGVLMVWTQDDISLGLERLFCSDVRCGDSVQPDEIRLTRRRMMAEPADVLFTSTEMLNQRLSSSQFGRLFGVGVRPERRPGLVLIDEVHSYEGTHGAHVALLLRRWRRATEANPQFVGLSATLADAPRFFAELVGIGPGDVAEVTPEVTEMKGEGAEYMVALRGDPSSGTSLLSTTIQTLMLLRRSLAPQAGTEFGTRVFAFTDNLDVINRLYHNLLDAEGWDSFGRPNVRRPMGSLANLRGTTLPSARERFDAGQNWAMLEDIGHVLAPGGRVRVARTSSQDAGVDPTAGIIVATSALEVGFDDPEVGAVLQHKAPQSSAAFLQRRGRAGRRQAMRPWTVVVLSDYGRDRVAYLGYDQLFSPYLPSRQLPLRNRAILKMQATYALFDWLARRLPPNLRPDPWTDLSQPVDEVANIQYRDELAKRQSLYAQWLKAILEQNSVREDFGRFLGRCLAIDDEEVMAILWEPPRSLITEAVPTLLRRLERGWRNATGNSLEQYVVRAPLPEFVPRTLFSDLQLPEVSIHIPAQGRLAARAETMPIAQALREFAPGRVSRRFGVSSGRERHWIDPGSSSAVLIDSFCPVGDRQSLGRFRYFEGSGEEREIYAFRPYALRVSQTPVNVQQSSNSFLDWAVEIVPTAHGHNVDLPQRSRWIDILKSLAIHSHNLGLPLEVRRFAVSATACVGRGKGQQQAQTVQFVCPSAEKDGVERAALGFVADVDGLQVSFAYPRDLYKICQTDPRLVRGLRVARFKSIVRNSPVLDQSVNEFQRDWLTQAYVSAIAVEAIQTHSALSEAHAAIREHKSEITIREVLETILQWGEEEDPDAHDDGDQHGAAAIPRRLQELLHILDQPDTQQALEEAVGVLWEPIDASWDEWLRLRFKSTLGAAMVETAYSLAPRMDPASLILDLTARVEPLSEIPKRGLLHDELWITESTIGGSGFIEDFVKQYVADPRRYIRLLENALAPSDLESVSEDLERTLDALTSDEVKYESLRTAASGVRNAMSYGSTVVAVDAVRQSLASYGIQPTPTLMVSVSTRLLGPGTSTATDRFLARILKEWSTAERSIGIDIDARVFALVKSTDTGLDNALEPTRDVDGPTRTASWRYGVLYSMFWPRGAQIRTESLRAWNPFARLPDCDRLLLLSAISRTVGAIALSEVGWFERLAELLVRDGVGELCAPVERQDELAGALLQLGTQAVDSEVLLVHARLAGVRRDGDTVIAELELPEAFQ